MIFRSQIGYWQFLAQGLVVWWLGVLGVEARVAGKIGYNDNYFSGKSYKDINDELIYISIGMGAVIILLIIIALCYIAHEKCKKQREFYITA